MRRVGFPALPRTDAQLAIHTRGRLLAALLSLVLLMTAAEQSVLAQAYPTAPVKVIVPFAAGGSTDLLARVFAERLEHHLGQSVVVENRGGAGGQIAAAAVARAPADGHTLMFTPGAPITIAPSISERVQYNSQTDFAPIAALVAQPLWLAVNARSSVQSWGDVVTRARSRPGEITYGTTGVGSELHLLAEALALSAGVKLTHVPYRGGGEIITALLGQQIDFGMLSTTSIVGPLKQGTLRALAVSSPKRMSDFPDVSTVAELGHPTAAIVPWWGMIAPAATPAPVIVRLTRELEKISQESAVQERLKAIFVQVDFAGAEEFSRRLKSEAKQFEEIIRGADLKLKP
jgi:tripartite-type tricarboxylate transporter receptor subunit TctC